MARLACAVVVLGVSLSAFGVRIPDASAQLVPPVSGPGVGGIIQGGACIPELSSYAADLSYYAGNGGVTATSAQAWVQCPVVDVTGLSSLIPVAVSVYIDNPSTTATTSCLLHRVSLTTGAIIATSSIVTPTSMTQVQVFSFSPPALSGGFYSLECYVAPGATLLGYFVNAAQ
jgi:hypothetical protein